MNKGVIFILLMIFGMSSAMGQSNNEIRLQKIDSEISIAVEQGDFDKAAELKREREIREEIKQALADGDFDKAAALKAQLENGETPQAEYVEDSGFKDEGITPQSDNSGNGISVDKSASKSTTPAGKSRITNSGFMVEMFLGFSNYQYSDNYFFDPVYQSIAGPSIGFKFGNKFYFGKKASNFRMGLGIHWVEVIASTVVQEGSHGGFSLAPVNPGLIAAWEIKEDIGIEVCYNFGVNAVITDNPVVGLGMVPQVKFRYKALAVGIESSIVNSLDTGYDEDMSFYSYGLTVGFKF